MSKINTYFISGRIVEQRRNESPESGKRNVETATTKCGRQRIDVEEGVATVAEKSIHAANGRDDVARTGRKYRLILILIGTNS